MNYEIATTVLALAGVILLLWISHLMMKIRDIQDNLMLKEKANKLLLEIMAKRKRKIETREAKKPPAPPVDWRRFVEGNPVLVDPSPPAPVDYMSWPVGQPVEINAASPFEMDKTQVIDASDLPIFELKHPPLKLQKESA